MPILTCDLKLRAASNIVNENNNCGHTQHGIMAESYEGRLQQKANISDSATCESPDGKSIVGFGTLPSGIVAYTCTWYSSDAATESDARLNSAYYRWVTDEGSGCQYAFNVDNIMTHERGHTFGLKDVYDSAHAELTMYGYSSPCKKNKETLALGDMRALNDIYPQ